jgi:predicted Zn-dependent protease
VSQPTTNGDVEDLEISVTASVDGRSATASDNRSDDASIKALVERAEELAKLAPVDPEHMPPLGKQTYAKVNAVDRGTAAISAQGRADVAGAAIRAAKDKGVTVAGFMQHSDAAFALANKAGLFAFHASTSVSLSTTCRTKDGTGSARAGFASHKLGGLEVEPMVARVAEKAERSRNPVALDPGRYTVVLEPDAVADLLGFLFWSLSARAADEGRSYFSKKGGGNRLGEKLFDERITLRSDPTSSEHPASPIGSGGLPRLPTTWIEKGVLEALSYSRYWAQKQGKTPQASPGSLHVEGGSGTVDDLVTNVDRGVLITRFWYNRMLDPRTILATGLTRDGTFLIEKGKIAKPVKNMRYNESPITLLKNVVAMSTPERAGLSTRRVSVVPAMVVEGFNLASVSEAI